MSTNQVARLEFATKNVATDLNQIHGSTHVAAPVPIRSELPPDGPAVPRPGPENHESSPKLQSQSSQHNGPRGSMSSSLQGDMSQNGLTRTKSQPLVAYPVSHSSPKTRAGSSLGSRPQSLLMTTTTTKSPFSTPITSPPRKRPNQILLINPTSTTILTPVLTDALRPNLPNGLELTAYSASYPAPTSVDTAVDAVLSAETVLRDLAKYSTNNGETIQNFDALLVAHYSSHPLIDALRESYDVPVVGIMEASLYAARMLGGRFGIICASTRSKVQIEDGVATHGLSRFLVGVESLHVKSSLDLLQLTTTTTTMTNGPESGTDHVGSGSLHRPSSSSISSPVLSKAREEFWAMLKRKCRFLIETGADTIILGSEFLSSNEVIRAIKDACRDNDGRRLVNVVDAVEAGVVTLNGLIGMGMPTSKKGLFRSEREARRGRGQTWL